MAILIDGYNLLHATGYIAAGSSYESLEGPRRKFLQFLQTRLPPDDQRDTTVVFDAANAPPGLPTRVSFGRILVLFAHDHAEADDLIEELIRADHVPQKLTVVSSDHRIHRAARRRRATAIDSDQWYWRIHDRPLLDKAEIAEVSSRDVVLNDDEVANWVALFGDADVTSDVRPTKNAEQKKTAERTEMDDALDNPFSKKYVKDFAQEIVDHDEEDIFPPGYGEDLLGGDDA